MRKSTFIILTTLLGASAVLLNACTPSAQHEKDSNISYYTCTMHPQVHKDHPGNCPICGMTLVPVYREAVPEGGKETSPAPPDAEHPLLSKERVGERSVRISPDRQQLIGLKTTVAEVHDASKEIRTTGRVAFDPDLAMAEREYLEVARNVPSLKEAAKSNLRLKGLSEEEIKNLDRVGKNLYLPGPGDSVWIYATLYQDELGVVSEGQQADVTLPSGPSSHFRGVVRSVDPVIDPMTRSARARIEVAGAGGSLRPETFVNVSLKTDLGRVLMIPKSAVIDTGTRQVAFVVTDGQNFQSRNIKTGPQTGDDIVVLEGVSEGDTVVSSAAFLVDSESQLKAAVR